jgi:general secretion pathway protein D
MMTVTQRACIALLILGLAGAAEAQVSKPSQRGVNPPPPIAPRPPPSPTRPSLPPAPAAPPAAAPAAPAAPPAAGTPAEMAYPGEKEATGCQKYPAGKKFKWDLRGEVDLMTMLNTLSPMLCRPFIVPGNIRQSKVTILAPNQITVNEAYRMFLSALESMGLTVQPQGKVLKIIETNRARESAIPIFGEDSNPANQDQYVTKLMRLEHVSPDDVKPVVERLKGKDGDITTYAPTNTLVITDLASNIARIEEVVNQLDVALGGEKVYVIPLHTVAATEMAQMLEKVFGITKPGTPAPRSRIAMNRAGANANAQPPPESPREKNAAISISQIIPDDRNNLLIVVGTEKAFQQILALVKRLDQQPALGDNITDRVHVIPLENGNAEDVAGTLGGLGAGVSKGGAKAAAPAAGQPGQHGLFEGDVRIASDKPTNSLVVVASGRDYITVRDLIKKLDIPRRQVFVEAVILEISVDKTRKLGLGFHGGDTVGSGTSQSLVYGASIPDQSVNSLVFNPAALSGLAAGLRGPPIPNASTILGLPPGASIPSFGVFLQAIQNNGDVNVISMPHILTTDNEKATIQVGQNLPFPGSLGGFPGFGAVPGASGSTPGASFGFGTSVQRQDVALKLEITPHVNESDYVRLEIDNELSDVANPNFNGLGPATSKRTVKSVVTVRDQQSIVLGGLIKDSVSETVNKVPFLGDIPILGYLFKQTSKTITKQNLLLIITPYIIKEPEDLRRVFERKVRERKEFLERYSAFTDEHDYEASVDYHRKRGLLEEINRTAIEAEQEASELRAAEEAMHARDISGAVEVTDQPTQPKSRLPRR